MRRSEIDYFCECADACNRYQITGNTRVRINLKNGGIIEYRYLDLLVRPLGVRTREFDSSVRKVVGIAANNGGWEIIR